MADFAHDDLLPLGADGTTYPKLTSEGVRTVEGPVDVPSWRSIPGCPPRPGPAQTGGTPKGNDFFAATAKPAACTITARPGIQPAKGQPAR